MSLKDNFNQAVKDFLKKDGMVGDDPFKGSVNTTQEDPSRSRNSYGTSYSDNLRAAASSYRQDPFAEMTLTLPRTLLRVHMFPQGSPPADILLPRATRSEAADLPKRPIMRLRRQLSSPATLASAVT